LILIERATAEALKDCTNELLETLKMQPKNIIGVGVQCRQR